MREFVAKKLNEILEILKYFLLLAFKSIIEPPVYVFEELFTPIDVSESNTDEEDVVGEVVYPPEAYPPEKFKNTIRKLREIFRGDLSTSYMLNFELHKDDERNPPPDPLCRQPQTAAGDTEQVGDEESNESRPPADPAEKPCII